MCERRHPHKIESYTNSQLPTYLPHLISLSLEVVIVNQRWYTVRSKIGLMYVIN